LGKLVLPDRIELSASPLPRECSTTELRQHLIGAGVFPLSDRRPSAIGFISTQEEKTPINSACESLIARKAMSKSTEANVREQRLAAKLRENLKRRKDQARARAARDDAPAPETDAVKKP
jgi:hypothetical protein